jgi:hypothetical protein
MEMLFSEKLLRRQGCPDGLGGLSDGYMSFAIKAHQHGIDETSSADRSGEWRLARRHSLNDRQLLFIGKSNPASPASRLRPERQR